MGDPRESTLASGSEDEEATEALLLAVLLGQERGAPLSEREVVVAAHASIGPTHDAARLADRWSGLVRSRWVIPRGTGWVLGSAGAEALGVGRATGATRETAEHRALLLEAFRLFARRGYRLEILRQGRFDTTLPDARLELLRTPHDPQEPEELARQVDRARAGWAWRFFHGRNVHVEAEVSGAIRAERIRNGCRKAERRGAFALFLVADALRARRVRSVLHSLGLGVDRAQVWTLRRALSARPPPGEMV